MRHKFRSENRESEKTGSRIDRDTGACNKSNHLNPTDNLSDRASDRLLQLVDNQSRT